MTPVLLPFALVMLGGFGLPLGVPPLPETQLLSKIAPEECVFYVSSSGMAAPDAKSPNQTEQLLAEPEVQKAVGKLEKMLRETLSKNMGQGSLPPGISSDDVADLAKNLLTRPMAVYISDIKVGAEGPNVRGGAVVKIDKDAEKLETALEQLAKALPPGMVVTRDIGGEKYQSVELTPPPSQSPPPSNIVPGPEAAIHICWGFKQNFFVVAVGEGEMEALLKRWGEETPGWLAKIRQGLPVERVSSVGFLNVKAILKIFLPVSGPQAGAAIEALGINNVKSIATVAGLDQSNYLSRLEISIDGEAQGLMRFASIEPLTAGDLSCIPADATTALAAKIDSLSIFNAFIAMMEKADPDAARRMHSDIEQAEAKLGLKIGDEMLRPLGNHFIYYSSTESGLPKMVALVRLKDPEQAAKTFSKLMPMIEDRFQEAAKGSPIALKLEKTPIAGKEGYTISVQQPGMPGGQFCWCLTEKELIFSLSAQSIEAYLSPPAGFKSLVQSPEIAKLFGGGAGPTSIIYWNTQETINRIYPALPILAAMLQSQGIKIDLSMLPPQNAIVPHLTPLVSSVRRTKSGIEIDERTPLPGLGTVVASPFLTGLILPAVQSGREAARRAASINNMKRIMLAMHMYDDANKTFPPAFKADKESKPLLSWRVLILPMMGYGDLYKEFRLDEAWDSEHNKKLITRMPPEYRSPNSNAGEGMTNYLTIRGENTVFPGKDGVRMQDITDGTAFTIAVVEASDAKAVTWTKPDDFEMDSNNPLKGMAGLHPSVFLAAFADGSVRELSATIDREVLKGLFSCNGGEAVEGKF